MEKKALLVDTNIFVDHLRNFEPAVKFFEQTIGKENIFFSAITEVELLAGTTNNNPEKRQKLLTFLNLYNKYPINNPVSEIAGDLSRKYGVDIPDAIIAATAIFNNAELITKNIKDFKKIPNLYVRVPY